MSLQQYLGEYGGGGQYAEDLQKQMYLQEMAKQDPSLASVISQFADNSATYVDAISKVLNTVVLADSQRRLLNVQLQRAQQGLPPLDASQVGLGVSFGLSPDTQKILLYAGGAAVALYLLSRGRK
jgi:hypothetical protein